MNDDISILLEFLGHCGAEATGHSLAELKSEQKALIERFVAGKCSDEERRKLSVFLLQNPTWIRWIADKVKGERERQP